MKKIVFTMLVQGLTLVGLIAIHQSGVSNPCRSVHASSRIITPVNYQFTESKNAYQSMTWEQSEGVFEPEINWLFTSVDLDGSYPTPDPTTTAPPIPTATPTSSPSSTSTPMPSDTPTSSPSSTSTPIPSDTPTSSPSSTSTPMPPATPTLISTVTPTPDHNFITVNTNRKLYAPFDRFTLYCSISTHDLSEPLDANLWLILDVYGEYFFFRSWTQEIDFLTLELQPGKVYHVDINGNLSLKMPPVLQFCWPEADATASDIIFWAGLTDLKNTDLVTSDALSHAGFDFQAQEHIPDPPIPETPIPHPNMQVNFINDDLECPESDIYCFHEYTFMDTHYFPVAVIWNNGSGKLQITVSLEGNDAFAFEIIDANPENRKNIELNPMQYEMVRVRFLADEAGDKFAQLRFESSQITEILSLEGSAFE